MSLIQLRRKLFVADFSRCDRRHLLSTLVVFVLLVTVAGACGSAGRGSRPGSQVSRVRTTIEVDNQSFNDMNVFIVNGGQRIRLGRATAHQKTEFAISATILSFGRELQFLAEPITRRGGSVSNGIWVEPGDRVHLLIPPG